MLDNFRRFSWLIFTVYTFALCIHGNNITEEKGYEYPPYDGWYNNPHNPAYGAIDTQLFRKVPPAYKDGVYEPSGHRRPNPINISMNVFNGSTGLNSIMNRTAFLVFFGQQVVEEILDAQRPGCPPEYFNIEIPKGHPSYDPDGQGGRELPVLRSRYDMNTGFSPNVPRQQINEITPFIDGGLFYGAAKAWSDALRSFKGGRLAALNDTDEDEYNFPALNDIRLPMANPPPPREAELKPIKRFYKLGNPRGNENPFLLTFGVMWFRYHNFRARQLEANHPDWSDEKLFNEARKWVIAIYQKIVMYDWLPAWTMHNLPPYDKYEPTINPNIAHVFQSAAMRFGHTLVVPGVFRRNASCAFRTTSKLTKFEGHRALRTCNTYWNPQEALKEQDIDEILLGMSSQHCEREDMIITPDLRGDVFGPLEFTRRDLMAINIQRARDHGIPDYNSVRKAYGLKTIHKWEDVNPEVAATDPALIERFRMLYGDSLDDVDLWPAGMLETNDDGPGELFRTIILDQFKRIRDGDRFWYENTNNELFTDEEIKEINSTTLHDVLLSVTNIKPGEIQQDPFFYNEGDPCWDPGREPLRAEDMENCTQIKRFDYFTGSEVSYAVSITALLSTFFMGLAALFCIAKRHESKVRKEQENKRKEGRGKAVSTPDGLFFNATEFLGKKEGEREVQVKLDSTKKTMSVVTKKEKKALRIVDTSLFEGSDNNLFGIVLSADKKMNMIVINVPLEHDLILIMENSKYRDDFHQAFKQFCDNVGVKCSKPDLKEEKFICTHMKTSALRKKQLEHFFKNIFNQAFHFDKSTPVDHKVSNLLELTKVEFAEALALKPESMFVQNIFDFADKDNNGYLNFQEFLNIIVVFSKGSPEEKAKLMFEMYDLKGNNYLSPDQFKTMLVSFVELANEKIEENKIKHMVDTILRDIGLDHQSMIKFKDFQRILKDYESELGAASLNIQAAGVDMPMPRAPVRAAAPTRARKTLVAYKNDRDERKANHERRISSIHQIRTIENPLPKGKFAQKWQEIVRYFQNYRLQIFWATLYTLVCIGVFAERSYYYSVEREHAGLRRIAGYGVSITRGAASGMMFTYSCLLVTMCRNLITFLRETFFHRYIPFDSAISFHKFIAYIAMLFTIMHIVGHCINFYHISTQTADDLTCLFRNFFHATDELPKFHYWMWGTITGFTGVLLTIVIFIMYIFATEYARRHAFRAFWITHHLHYVLWILMILHGAGRLVQAPFFQYFFLGPVILYTLDKLVSLSRKKVEINVFGAELLPSDVTHLVIQKPSTFEYKSGQWVRIAALKLGDNEYHPFTLSSAPHEENLSLHIRAVGPWTHNLRRLYDPSRYEGTQRFPKIYLDGPYGEGHQDWYRYDVAILVGGGIGVTPFASILKDLAHKSKNNMKLRCKKVYFIWVTRSQKQFEWMTDIIREVEENDQQNLVSCHIFITQFKEKFDVRTTMLYICERNFQKISGRSLFTGLRSVTHFGRPDFQNLFGIIQQEHMDTHVFGVFSCGPPPMTATVDKACGHVNKYMEDVLFVHHFENF